MINFLQSNDMCLSQSKINIFQFWKSSEIISLRYIYISNNVLVYCIELKVFENNMYIFMFLCGESLDWIFISAWTVIILIILTTSWINLMNCKCFVQIRFSISFSVFEKNTSKKFWLFSKIFESLFSRKQKTESKIWSVQKILLINDSFSDLFSER